MLSEFEQIELVLLDAEQLRWRQTSMRRIKKRLARMQEQLRAAQPEPQPEQQPPGAMVG